MALIDDLVSRIVDPALRDGLAKEVERMRASKKFGLVFERHLPEEAILLNATVRPGCHVTRRDDLSLRGVVQSVTGNKATVLIGDKTDEVKVDDLTVVKRIGEPIYPTLDLVETVKNGGKKRWHTLVEADNFHALQLLCYTHRAMVDVIYIDPPYNTKAKTWKYNNDFVDGNDSFRHSKWLSFMHRRLFLAQRLLKPDGILIVAIDENELATLGMLLRDLFPQHEITPVSVVHNPRGIQGDNFSYTHETLYFVIPKDKELISERALTPEEIAPSPLKKWGNDAGRDTAAKCFYPIWFDSDGKCVGAGEVADDGFHPKERVVKRRDGTWEYWPIDDNGEGKWRYARQTFDKIQGILSVTCGKSDDECDDEEGDVEGSAADLKPRPPADFREATVKIRKTTGSYKTFWRHESFDSSSNGKQLINKFIKTDFPYPKSLYAVMEALKATTMDRKDAVILDFFAGSGTTLHAASLLNAADGGTRQCILVTNNEIGPVNEKKLRKAGVRPGDERWEEIGICRSVTWPRLKNCVTGVGRNGKTLPPKCVYRDPITLDKKKGFIHKMGDGFKENVAYYRLGYTDPREVGKGEAFGGLRSIFWLLAGGHGSPAKRMPDPKSPWLVDEDARFAVIFDGVRAIPFSKELTPAIETVFVVADSVPSFTRTVAAIGDGGGRRFVHIYRSYLESFALNTVTDI